EVPTQDEEEETEPTPTEIIEKLVEEETLNNQQRNNAILSLKEFEDLFTTNLKYIENYYYADEEWQEEFNLLLIILNEAEPIEYENNDEEDSDDMSEKEEEEEEVIISYAEEERQHEILLQQLTQESGQELPRSDQGYIPNNKKNGNNNLDRTYPIDLPRWGESTTGLKFEKEDDREVYNWHDLHEAPPKYLTISEWLDGLDDEEYDFREPYVPLSNQGKEPL
ncbi:12416_t:CDS:2, partial [Cetraspora pellucida]